MLRERSAEQYQQIVLEKKEKKFMSSWLPFLKLKGLLAPEISKFTKIRKFQTNFYANLRLLNDYGLIISIKTNEKVYVHMLYFQNCRPYKHANLLSHFSACTKMGK